MVKDTLTIKVQNNIDFVFQMLTVETQVRSLTAKWR